MRALAGAAVGAGAALGVVLVIRGWAARRGEQSAAPVAGLRVPSRPWSGWWAMAACCFAGGWLITGWPAAAMMSLAAPVVARRAAASGRQRAERAAMADALAGWAEMLADVMRSHSGLGQAVRETAPHAAPILRPSVAALARRSQTASLSAALAEFADDVDDATTDLLVAALRLVGDGGGRNLPEVLGKIAGRTRARAEMLQRVEAGRARLYSEARAMMATTGAMAAIAIAFGRSYLTPYDSARGQLVLLVVGALFTGAGLALVQLGRPVALPAALGRWSAGGIEP